MARQVIHISEQEASRHFTELLARVRAGVKVIINEGDLPVAVVHPAEPHVRLLSESLRMARELRSSATLDGDFATDLEHVINSHREPLTPPSWE